MVDLPEDISYLVFRPNFKKDATEMSLDGQTLGILMELDGKKEISVVRRALNMDMGTMRAALSRMLELGLVEIVDKSVPPEFVVFLTKELSKAAGPIAEVLLEDVAIEIGINVSSIPQHRVAELVDALSRYIPSDERKAAFTHSMLNRLKQLKS